MTVQSARASCRRTRGLAEKRCRNSSRLLGILTRPATVRSPSRLCDARMVQKASISKGATPWASAVWRSSRTSNAALCATSRFPLVRSLEKMERIRPSSVAASHPSLSTRAVLMPCTRSAPFPIFTRGGSVQIRSYDPSSFPVESKNPTAT